MEIVLEIWQATGLYNLSPGQALMMPVCLLLIYLGVSKGFEPLLLVPIGFGGLLANIPVAAGDVVLAFDDEAIRGDTRIHRLLVDRVGEVQNDRAVIEAYLGEEETL